MAIRFEIQQRDAGSRARRGMVTTSHGAFDTPAFMTVGTRATVKGLLPSLVAATGAQIILGNTYHLMLRPGSDLVAQMGGLHPWMRWPGPILTDSGGFQVFSMSDINRIDDDGVRFKSHLDGSEVVLTPERSMQVQNELGADIIMAFDDCPPADAGAGPGARTSTLKSQASRPSYAQRLREANERTVRWLERCDQAHARKSEQALFGIVQGGTDLEQRCWCAQRVTQVDLPGYAIGGVAVGETTADIRRVVEHTAPLLPDGKPRYLMGVGYEKDIVAAVRAGVDMFDCVLPTRNGRNSTAFTTTGRIKLRNAQFRDDPRPIEEGCDCPACAPSREPQASGLPAGFSRSYLRHLFLADEMLGPILVSLHNLRHFQRLMLDIREAIHHNDWSLVAQRWPVAAEGL